MLYAFNKLNNHYLIESLIQDLPLLQHLEVTKEDENRNFHSYLKQQDGKVIDRLVHQLNDEVSEAIDCTACGNCCRSLMINIEPGEPEVLSEYLKVPLPVLRDKYIEESQQGNMIINAIPCHFLENNKCTVYEHRFKECRDFPHLHKPGFIQRFPGTLMHYGRCPIIFNVMESLKSLLHYEYNPDDE